VSSYGSHANEGASSYTTVRGEQLPAPTGATAPNRSDTAANEKSTKAIEEALKDMSMSAKDLGRTYQVMEDVLKAMNSYVEKISKGTKGQDADAERLTRKWKDINVSVTSMVRSVDDAEDSFRKILSIQHQMSRDPGFFNRRSTADVKQFYADLLKQTERISKVGLGAKGMQELKAVTDGLKKSMAELGGITGKTLNEKQAKKFADQLRDINEQVIEIGDNVKGVKFSVWGDAMKKADTAFEQTFDKRFAGTAFGQMVLGKFGKQFEQIKSISKLGAFGKKLQEIPKQQRAESLGRLQKNLGENHPITQALMKEHQARTGTAATGAGAPGTAPAPATTAAAATTGKKKKPNKKSGAGTGTGAVPTPAEAVAATTAAAAEGAAVEVPVGKGGRGRNKKGQFLPKGASEKITGAQAPSVTASNLTETAATLGKGSGISGWIDRKIGNLALKHAGKALGGEAIGGLGGLIGKGAMRLVGAGAGSATAGAAGIAGGGLAGGVLGGVGNLLTKANPIMMAVGAIISARDMVVKENKEMQETLGGFGLNANEGGTNFTGARKTLMSTGTLDKTLYGMGTYRQNLEMMGALGHHGYSIADISSENDNVRPDLGKSMELGQGGFYGSLMKNTQYYGRNLGMDTKQSTGLTMDLAEKYRTTMEDTSKFFLQIDIAQRTAGVSAMKYVQIVEDINSQFDEFNRGLRTTTTLLNVLGRSGRMTGDQLKDMAKGLTANANQNLAQQVVTATKMVSTGENKTLANDLEKGIADAVKAAQGTMSQTNEKGETRFTPGFEGAPKFTGNNQNEVLAWMDKNKNKDKINPQDYRQAAIAMQSAEQMNARHGAFADVLRKGDVGQIGGAMTQMGEDPRLNMLKNRSALEATLTHSGVISDKTGGLAGMLKDSASRRKLMSNPLALTAMQQSGVFAGKTPEEQNKMVEALGLSLIHI